MAELMARAHAIARRIEGTITNKMIVGRLTIDRALRRAVMENEEIHFSFTEFDILIVLACDYGKVVPREKLEEIIKVNDSENMQNLLDVSVLKLRKKLGNDAIINRRNDGFFLNV